MFIYKIKNWKLKQAFTLIEMMVTLSIITLLTSMVLVYSRQSESLTNLMREADRLMFNLHQIQNSSLLTLQQNIASQKICGWGIYFDPADATKYVLFHDFCLPNSNQGNNLYDSNNGEGYEIVNLLKGVYIKKSDFQSLVFVPPNPDIKVSYDGIQASTLTTNLVSVQLCLVANPNSCFNVSINPAGQIAKTQ